MEKNNKKTVLQQLAEQRLMPILVLTVALAVTAWAWKIVRADGLEKAKIRFVAQTDNINDEIIQRMHNYEYALRSVAGLFDSIQNITNDNWRNYFESTHIVQDYSGILSIAFAKRVLSQEKESHIKQIQNEGAADYAIWPSGEGPEYFPFIYVAATEEKNPPASGKQAHLVGASLGYDSFTDPIRRKAMEKARDSGIAVVTDQIVPLASASAQSRSVHSAGATPVPANPSMYLPVYQAGQPHTPAVPLQRNTAGYSQQYPDKSGLLNYNTIDERRAALAGFICCSFSEDELLTGLIGNKDRDIHINFFHLDLTGPVTNTWLSNLDDIEKIKTGLPKNYTPKFTRTTIFDIYERTWTLQYQSLSYFNRLIDNETPRLVLTFGIIISLLLFGMTMILARRIRALTLTADMSAALQESDERFRSSFDHAAIGMALMSPDGRYLKVNQSLCGLLGYPQDELLSISYQSITPKDDISLKENYQGKMIAGEFDTCSIEKQYIHKSGRIIYVQLNSSLVRDIENNPLYFINQIQDITTRKRIEAEIRRLNSELEQRVLERTAQLQESNKELKHKIEEQQRMEEEKQKVQAQLLHAQKMEVIGQLAGGVAHDFNNILAAIMSYGYLLNTGMTNDNPLRTNVEQIMTAAERGANLTQSLLAFSRKQPITLKTVQLNDIIRNVERFLVRIIGEDVKLKIELANQETTVRVDQGQIEQIMVNLATNARDAMAKGGLLTVTTEITEINDEFIKLYHYGAVGKYVLISVKDAGTGMDQKTIAKIFEPFFTTKDVGKGTGLGLAIVYGIVKQHNGYINVNSEIGVGTRFDIYLPCAKAGLEETKPLEPVVPIGGSETLLLAEDSPELRKITKELLGKFGYEVLDAADGEEAVKIFKENSDKIKLLLFDIIMPKKSGIEAYNEIRQIEPDIRIAFISGYTMDVIRQKGIIEKESGILFKPVSPMQLLKKIREVLDK